MLYTSIIMMKSLLVGIVCLFCDFKCMEYFTFLQSSTSGGASITPSVTITPAPPPATQHAQPKVFMYFIWHIKN